MKKEVIEDLSRKLFEDGFVHVKSLLNGKEIDLLKKAIESNLKKLSPFAVNIKQSNHSGKFFMDFNNWRRLPLIEMICRLPKLVKLVTDLTNSNNCWLFHDHTLVKSGIAKPTPIHHDRPYHIFKGNLNCSVWITADNVPKGSSLIFYKSSHKQNKIFLPKAFMDGINISSEDKSFVNLDNYNLKNHPAVDFEMAQGDAVVFFNTCLHSSHAHESESIRRALSIRYLLDGALLTKKYINATPPFDRMGVNIVEDGPVPESFFPKLKG